MEMWNTVQWFTVVSSNVHVNYMEKKTSKSLFFTQNPIISKKNPNFRFLFDSGQTALRLFFTKRQPFCLCNFPGSKYILTKVFNSISGLN
uniref:Ovule protein n=1 Tax=Romanomermis culicivorax TaxID=13658 RepID=A0A915K9Q9_ROMCU